MTDPNPVVAALEAAICISDTCEVHRDRVALLRAALPLARAQARSEYLLRNLLAIIHRDGGHYTADNGIEKSVECAIEKSAARIHDNEVQAERIAELEGALRVARGDFLSIAACVEMNEKDYAATNRAASRIDRILDRVSATQGGEE